MASKRRIIGVTLAVIAAVGGGILVAFGHSGASAVLFVVGCIGVGLVLPPTDHDTTGSHGASDST